MHEDMDPTGSLCVAQPAVVRSPRASKVVHFPHISNTAPKQGPEVMPFLGGDHQYRPIVLKQDQLCKVSSGGCRALNGWGGVFNTIQQSGYVK